MSTLIQCPICKKQFEPHRPNQVVCGSINSTCKKKYKYLQRHGQLDKLFFSYSHQAFQILDEDLENFLHKYPATVQEVLAAETVPNLGLVRQLPQRPRFY